MKEQSHQVNEFFCQSKRNRKITEGNELQKRLNKELYEEISLVYQYMVSGSMRHEACWGREYHCPEGIGLFQGMK